MPPHPATLLRRNAQRALRSAAFEDARAALEQLAQLAPYALETRALQLEYLVRRRQLDEARALAKELVAVFPGSAHVHFWSGRAAYAAKQYGEAEAAFRESGRLAPAWNHEYWLGKTLTQLGRLDEAEPLLRRVVETRGWGRCDLAWLYERKGDDARALDLIEAHLRERPEDEHALAQRDRLRARSMRPGELTEEVETLAELGEQVPEPVFAEYIDRLLCEGRGADARAAIDERAPALTPRAALTVGWTTYRLQAYDLAFELFALALPTRPGDAKLLSAIEKAAKTSGRVGDLIAVYERLAPERRPLYGRIRKLRAALDRG